MSQEKVNTKLLKRYCVVCEREWAPHYEKCCTENSLVALKTEGFFKKRKLYYGLDGKLLNEKDLSELREREIASREQRKAKPESASRLAAEASVEPPTGIVDPEVAVLVASFEAASNSPKARAGAVLMMGKTGSRSVIPYLLNALRDREGIVRAFASHALGQIGDQKAVDPLVVVLADEDRDVRYETVQALGLIRDRRAVVPLIDLLSDGEVEVRRKVVEVLEQFGDQQAIEPLLAKLQDESWEVRCDAVKALTVLSVPAKGSSIPVDKRALQPLIAVLRDDHVDVRHNAAFALGLFEDNSAVMPLITALTDEGSGVRENAAASLERITGQSHGLDYEKWKSWQSPFEPVPRAQQIIQDAVAQAMKSGKRVLVEVGGPWCKWSFIMDRFFQEQTELRRLRDESYVLAKVDLVAHQMNLAETFPGYPSFTSVPHLFVLESDGRVLHSQSTDDLEFGQSYDPARFRVFLEQWAHQNTAYDESEQARMSKHDLTSKAASMSGEKDSRAAPTPLPRQSRPQASSRFIVVRGSWMNALWSDVPVRLPEKPVLPDFLEQDPLPPLLEDDEYAQSNESTKDRLMHWIVALLHHPNEQVVLGVFQFWEMHWARYVESEVNMSYRTLLFDSAADHLLSTNEELAEAAARFVWRGYSERNFANMLSILADPHYRNKTKAVERLRLYCPPEHEAAFERMVK